MQYRLGAGGQLQRRRKQLVRWLAGLAALAVLVLTAGGLQASPTTSLRLYWEWDQLRGATRDFLFRSSDTLPRAASQLAVATPAVSEAAARASYEEAAATPQAAAASSAPTAQPSPTPIIYNVISPPAAFKISGFQHEFETPNNCGPATLAILLRYWKWKGDQEKIAAVLKPQIRDRNVRWDELVQYVRTHAGWLNSLFRVGGSYETLQLFVANGYPLIIETGYELDVGWVGHYLLVTGYDAHAQTVIVQDVTGGPNRIMQIAAVDKLWQQFNRLYIVVYPVADAGKIAQLLGPDADLDSNRARALEQAAADRTADTANAFAWFTHGSNLNYFERYTEAAADFDKARELGLPWRMLFYQFGPYAAYFNVGRYQDVIDLSTATLNARPELEESYVWRGWAWYMLGKRTPAITDFRAALAINPNFTDAQNALGILGVK